MAIWEPCNYVSNLAYDRLVVEVCNQKDWTLGEVDVKRIAEAFAIGMGKFYYNPLPLLIQFFVYFKLLMDPASCMVVKL